MLDSIAEYYPFGMLSKLLGGGVPGWLHTSPAHKAGSTQFRHPESGGNDATYF